MLFYLLNQFLLFFFLLFTFSKPTWISIAAFVLSQTLYNCIACVFALVYES